VAVDRGDQVEVDLEAHLVRGEYIWNWKSAVRCGGAGEPPVRFSQSTFFSTPLSPGVLRAPAGAGHRG
jgi:hypothetical protein